MLTDYPILEEVRSFIMATGAETFLFCVAMAAYLLLFSNQAPNRGGKPKTPKGKLQEEWEDDQDSVRNSSKTERDFQIAFEAGNFREAMRCWGLLKRSETAPAVSLASVVEVMQRLKRDTPSILREVKAFFRRYPHEGDVNVANRLLESLGRRLDSELADRLVEMLPSLGLEPDTKTFEILLHIRFTTRDFAEVSRLVAQMEASKVPMSARASLIAVKTALKTGDLEQAVRLFMSFKTEWDRGDEASSSPSTAPRHILAQIVELACKEHQLGTALPLLQGSPLSDEAITAMLTECARKKDPELSEQVERLVRSQRTTLTDAMYALIVRAVPPEASQNRIQELCDEVISQDRRVNAELLQAFLAHCSQLGNVRLADRLFEHSDSQQSTVITSFLRFYAEGGFPERACEVYEQHFKPLCSSEGNGAVQAAILDTRLERSLMNAALRCGRQELAKDILDSSPSDVVKHLLLIKNFAAADDLKGVMNVFNTLVERGAELGSVVYNSVLEACVECRDLAAAEAWMRKTKEAGFADVVSYNTLIKAHLHTGHFSKARALITQMREVGLQPNHVTFNELVNGMISKGSEVQRREVWEIVKEMRVCGVKPNQVTCSILLKNLNRYSREDDIVDTMELINTMEAPMDEVLLSSVVEACVRIGKPDLLASKLRQFQDGNDAMLVNGSHTFGSLIKAYGYAKDISSVWRCWRAMRSRHIRPTSITLGCMVEAVVSNGDTEGAYELIHEMYGDERCRDTLNSVIYCSVLKGFTREKKLGRVWSVYQEMLERNIDLSVVTYNTVIDACARCGRMDRLTELLADMKRHGIACNLITYSTMLKGYCQMGDIQKGFAIFEQMKQEIDQKPDEIMYNSLLDGCAQMNLVEEGLGLVRQMEKEGVAPSNFTLSLVVKLMSRARRADRAFSLVEEISQRHRIRLNVHVYTNLMQACISNRQTNRAIGTFEDMLRQGVRPEGRTYAVLIRASLSTGDCHQAVALLRAALGLRGALPAAANSTVSAVCNNIDNAVLNEALKTMADKGLAQELAVPLVSDIRRFAPHVHLDSGVQRKVMAAGVEQETGLRLPIQADQEQQASGARNYGRGGPAGPKRGNPGGNNAGRRRPGQTAVPAY